MIFGAIKMKKTMWAALLLGLAASSSALADQNSISQGISQGDVLGRVRVISIEPQASSNGTLSAINTGVNNSMVPELDFTYMALDHVGIELILATSRHTVTSNIGKLGSKVKAAEYRVATEGEPVAGSGADPFHIGMLIFPGMTNLDFAGPFEVLSRGPNAVVHVLGHSMEPVRTDVGGLLLPTMTLADAPCLDMLFVGGGPGVNALMSDKTTLQFLSERAQQAQWVTSVCTGALVLGAAGLLRGYKAATHWTAMDVLPILGARPIHERVVVDRNRITGGGVTAGIDFGLDVARLLWGRDVAQKIALFLEYDPQPPFSGSPLRAPREIVAEVRETSATMTDARMAAARIAMRKFV